MSDPTTALAWFRLPSDTHPGTLNACYNAVDQHVIAGRADDVALVGDRDYSYARLLTEVAALAGALRALGVSAGDQVLVSDLPPVYDVLATLACARLGAVVHETAPPAPVALIVGTVPATPVAVPVITADDTGELPWETAMTAGRTDPAACHDVPGDAILRVVAGRPVPTAAYLSAVIAGEVDDPVLGPLLAGGTVHLPG